MREEIAESGAILRRHPAPAKPADAVQHRRAPSVCQRPVPDSNTMSRRTGQKPPFAVWNWPLAPTRPALYCTASPVFRRCWMPSCPAPLSRSPRAWPGRSASEQVRAVRVKLAAASSRRISHSAFASPTCRGISGLKAMRRSEAVLSRHCPVHIGSWLEGAGQLPFGFMNIWSVDLLVLHDALDRRALDHAVLERGVVLELAHRQLAPHAPGVEHEAIGIEHRVLVAEPFAARQHAVDLLQVAVEGLEAGFLDAGNADGSARVALGPADMGVRGMHAGGKEADQRQRLGFGQLLLRPQAEALAEIGQDGGVLGQRLAVVEAQQPARGPAG